MIAPAFGAFFGFVVVFFLAVYVYSAWALMTIALKTNTEPAWLAWIPIANIFLLPLIAQVPWWTALIALLSGFIPVVGWIVSTALAVWWWWQIAERLDYEGWLGILMIVPVVNLVLLGVFAWKDQ